MVTAAAAMFKRVAIAAALLLCITIGPAAAVTNYDRSGVVCAYKDPDKTPAITITSDEWAAEAKKNNRPGTQSDGCHPQPPYDTIWKGGTWYHQVHYDGKIMANIWIHDNLPTYICDIWWLETDKPATCDILNVGKGDGQGW